MNALAKANKLNSAILSGRDLEPFVEDEINKAAKGTPFQGTIVRWSGQMFPDIVAHKYYGIEVKSTKQDHWTSTGNSVLESTRVKGVERIYMMFGKLVSPIEFKCRPYEECLSEVVVTHSPRYLIDMDLPVGQTIFDKMKTTYDKVRLADPPLEPVLDYYRSKLKPGQQIWWLGNTSSLIMKFWSSLTPSEKNAIRLHGFVFFPEIFGKRQDKFNDMASWLVQKQNIVCPNMRDIYTAGGQENVIVNGNRYADVPRVIANALQYLPDIIKVISTVPVRQLTLIWKLRGITRANAVDKWIETVAAEAHTTYDIHLTIDLFNDYRIHHGL